MKGLLTVCVCAAALLQASAAAGALEVRLVVKPARPTAGADSAIELRTFAPLARPDGSCCRLGLADPRGYPFRVQAVSPDGRVVRVRALRTAAGVWRGSFRFDRPGRWEVRVANFGPSYRHAPGARPRLTVQVGPPVSPAGFGPLGQPNCNPPSPRNRGGPRFPALGEVFGTAPRGQLWALFFLPRATSWASPEAAVVEGLVAKEVKIVFRMTGVGGFSIAATGPVGTTVPPVWGPTPHGSSTWNRPGSEWGAGFVLPEPGCWRIRAQRGTVTGEVWLQIRS